MIRMWGASDDLIEIDGHIIEELNPTGDDGDILVCSDGSAFKVTYDGCWRFVPLSRGTATYTKVEAIGDEAGRRPDGTSGYSDVVTLDGDIKWVALAEPSRFAKK